MRVHHLCRAGIMVLSLAPVSYGDVVFTFLDNAGTVTMTPSGSIDTSNLLTSPHGGWGGTTAYISSNGGYSLMGSTGGALGPTNYALRFSPGTDYSDWLGGPFSSTIISFVDSGTTPFSTYSLAGINAPGLIVNNSDLIGSIWTPDNAWTATGSLAGFGWTLGTYTVSDASTGESITFQIGSASAASVPEPGSFAFLGLGLLGFGLFRFRQRRAV